jgi:hypothetical protein
MKYDHIEMHSGRMFCPSTNEEIFTLDDLVPINEQAKALIATWCSEYIDEPVFNHEGFRDNWESFLNKNKKQDVEFMLSDFLYEFLVDYEESCWRVFEISTSGFACGPIYSTEWYVVLADTIIEGNIEDEEETVREQNEEN